MEFNFLSVSLSIYFFKNIFYNKIKIKKGDIKVERLSRTVQGIFALIFGFTILSVIVRGYIKYPAWGITLVIVCGFLFMGAVVWLYGYMREKTLRMTRKEIDRMFFCIAGAVLLIQIISAFALKFTPISDLSYVDTAARDFCQTWDKADLDKHLDDMHKGYFARYTNNQALLVILSLIYAACNKLMGTMPMTVPVLINTIGLHISYILMYFISGKLFRDKFTPLFCAVMGALFSVFYTYTPYFYTDSMSMPFAMGSMYLFLCGIENPVMKKKIPQLVFSGLLLFTGFKIKGNVIILLPVYLLYLAVTCTKANRKAYLKGLCILLAGLTASSVLCTGFIKSFDIADESQLEELQFPPEHWVMMGLHDRGGYYNNDFLFTFNSGNYEQKKAADINEIKNRVADYGVTGMIKHIAKKVSYTWGDGTYFIGHYLKHCKETNVFKRFVAKSDVFKFLCSVYQCMLLFMILLSFINGAFSARQGKEIFLKIVICGVFFFFILWETRSRYLVNFSPVFIITSAYSVKVTASAVKRHFSAHRRINIENKLKNAV